MFNQSHFCYASKTSENIVIFSDSKKRENWPNIGQHGKVL